METVKVFEDDTKLWVIGIPKKFALEMLPDVEWETVFIKVIDPPKELLESFVKSKASYIFSECPVTGGIESSWCIKDKEPTAEVVLSEEEFEKFQKGGPDVLKEIIKEKLDGGV